MSPRVLHVLDATTPPDAMEFLAQVLPALPEQRLVALGHRSTADLANGAGILPEKWPITFLHSMGWADPTGWRGLKRIVKEYQPTHVHAWGIPGAFAAVMTRFMGQRLVTLVDLPRAWHLQLLTFIHKGGLWVSPSPCRWIVTSTWLKRELHALTIGADAVSLVRPCVDGADMGRDAAALREDLGLLAEDGPILLLGGDGGVGSNGTMLAEPGVDPMPHGGRGGPRHDVGLWAAAILQQIFPRIRAIVREDPRAIPDHGLERLLNNLPGDDIVVVAPATCSWQRLLSVADILLVTPDGPFAAGSILHAMAARVPVVGTPVDAVREHIVHQQNGIVAASNKPREIAAAVEALLAQPDWRLKYCGNASAEAGRGVEMRPALQALYVNGNGNGIGLALKT